MDNVKENQIQKLLASLKLPDDLKIKYQELGDLISFKQEQRINNVKNINYEALIPILEKKVSKLDKITKFQNKLKEGDGHFKKKVQDAVLKEVKDLNLLKFITEIVQQIIDSHLNNTKYFVELSGNLYQNYAEFIPALLAQIQKHIEQIDLKQGTFENEAERSKKRKNLIRYLGEIQSAGMLLDKKEQYVEIIQQLVLPQTAAAQNTVEFFIINLKVGLTYLQYFAFEIFDTKTYQQRQNIDQYPDLAQLFIENSFLTNNQKSILREFFLQKFQTKIKVLMKQVYLRIEEITLQTITEFGEDTKAKEAKEQFNKLRDGLKSVLDYFGLYDPSKTNQCVSEEDKIYDLNQKEMEAFKDVAEGDPFELEEEKLLYIQLVDLKESVPKEILKKEKDALSRAQVTGGRDEQQVTDEFFKRFKDCMTLDIADELSVDFCYINTKKNRKSIIDEMCVYRNNYILLAPFQCRLVANLNKQFKELGEECTKYMLEQLKSIRSSDTHAFDKKQRFVRYICELTKFKVMRQDIVMDVFQSFLDDLINQNIELTVILIENCGRFLLRSNESYRKFKFQLEQLTKMRGTKPLSQQLDYQLENAINSLNLNQQSYSRPQKQKTTLQRYIKYLLFEQLSSDTFALVHKELLKLPHKNAECHKFLYKYLIKLSIKGRYSQLDLAAGIICVFKSHYPTLVGQIVDHILEEIQLGLEDNQFNLRQKRLTLVKYLGEFYNFKIIELDLLLNILYQFIEYGHDSDIQRNLQDLIDPPDDTFRITQVIVLIECVKEFIKKFKNKLIRFLVFFQRYALSKSYIPQTVEFNILDMYEMVDPNLKNIKSTKQAEALCVLILDQEVLQQTIDYEVELQKMFGNVVEYDNTLEQLQKKQKEDDVQEQESQKQLAQEFDQQYNRMMAESQLESRQKKQVTVQPSKKVMSRPIQKGNNEVKVIQRTVELGKDQNTVKKQMKRNQQQELLQFINFNNLPDKNDKKQT